MNVKNSIERGSVMKCCYFWIVLCNEVENAEFLQLDDAVRYKEMMEKIYSDCKWTIKER